MSNSQEKAFWRKKDGSIAADYRSRAGKRPEPEPEIINDTDVTPKLLDEIRKLRKLGKKI